VGMGQLNTPINHHNQGEVLTPSIEKSVFILAPKRFPGTQTFPSAHHPPDDEPSGYSYKIGEAD